MRYLPSPSSTSVSKGREPRRRSTATGTHSTLSLGLDSAQSIGLVSQNTYKNLMHIRQKGLNHQVKLITYGLELLVFKSEDLIVFEIHKHAD